MNIGVGLTLPPDCKLHACVPEMFMEFVGLVDGVRFKPYVADGIYIDCNRNNVASRFMKEKWADVLWFVDGDNGLSPAGFLLMLDAIQKPEVKILSGVYATKGCKKFEGCVPLGWNSPKHISRYMFDGIEMKCFDPPGKLFDMSQDGKVAIVPGGCLMVKREVFEKTPYPWFLCMPEINKEPFHVCYVGEDNYFAVHVQNHGFHIWLEPRAQVSHCEGNRNYTIGGLIPCH